MIELKMPVILPKRLIWPMGIIEIFHKKKRERDNRNKACCPSFPFSSGKRKQPAHLKWFRPLFLFELIFVSGSSVIHSPMVPYPPKIKPEQNCSGYSPIENHNSAISCCNVNEPQSPAVTSYGGQASQMHNRPMRDCNMNDTFIMQLASAPKGHVPASCGFGMNLPQQGFTFRLPMPNAHIPSVGRSLFFTLTYLAISLQSHCETVTRHFEQLSEKKFCHNVLLLHAQEKFSTVSASLQPALSKRD